MIKHLTIPKKLLGIAIIIVLIIIALTVLFNSNAHPVVPKIKGVVIVEPQKLSNFKLTTHNNTPFEQNDLLGKWHFISYGYTHCPDICPTTLLNLTQLKRLLEQELLTKNAGFVFYTVDPDRDTAPILSRYLKYFDRNFIGLRAEDNDNFLPFEQGLGIKVKFNNKQSGNKVYEVSHSTAILIINPKAQLQAVLLPDVEQIELKVFEAEQLFNDYLKVINYYQTKE